MRNENLEISKFSKNYHENWNEVWNHSLESLREIDGKLLSSQTRESVKILSKTTYYITF